MYILVAILIFGFLIFVHELGHFLAAKKCGVQVNEFSINMGPAIAQKTVGETTYSLRCIPIGGYCAMEGENEESDNPRAFSSQSWYKKVLILIAGSFMNYLAGFLILTVIFSFAAGFSTSKIAEFYDGCPFEGPNGLQINDEIYQIDGKRVFQFSDVGMLLSRNTSGVYDLVVKRGGKTVSIPQFPMQRQKYVVEGKEEYLYGFLFQTEEKSFSSLLKNSFYGSLDFARLVWMGLGDLLRGTVSVNEMSGPVGIVSVIAETGQSSQSRLEAVVNIAYLAAFIAVNLAVMNMMPFPALDGGRVFFLLVNALFFFVTKKKIPEQYEAYVHAAGMVLLLAFMAFVTFKDIWKLIF